MGERISDRAGGDIEAREADAAGRIAAALGSVGSRLRKVREQRGLTLTEAATLVKMSKSTLSRLETGQRKPSLELLLPLAELYRVPLDELVGAPEVGDPRIRLKPRRVHGSDCAAVDATRRNTCVEDHHPDVTVGACATSTRRVRMATCCPGECGS